MDSVKYVCEPHYDENGNFDYWNPLFPYKRDTCEGCEHEGENMCMYSAYCHDCTHVNYNDLYEPKVVE